MNRTLGIALAVIGTMLVASTVAAQEEPEPPEPIPAANGSLTMELLDQSFDLAPNGTIRLRYRLIGDLDAVVELAPPTAGAPATTTEPAPPTGPTAENPEPVAEPLPVVTARILNYVALDDPDELVGLVGPDPRLDRLPPVIDGVDIFDIRSSIEVLSPTEAVLDLEVPTDTDISVSERLEFNDDGITPIVVQLRVDDQVVARHGTVVERRSGNPTTPPTIDLALFGGTEDPGLDGSPAEFDDAVEVFTGLVDNAAELDTVLTLAIPPSVVTESIESGDIDPADRLLSDVVILAQPATPFDVSSAVAVGRVDAFTRQLRVGEDEVAAAIGQTPSRDIWSATSELSGPAAQSLRDLGVRFLAMPPSVYRTTIADDRNADIPAVDRFIRLPLPDGGQIPVLVLDEEFGADLTRDGTTEITAARSPAEWSIETIADLRLGQYAAPENERGAARSHLIATPGLGPFDTTLIAELERLATTTEAIRFTPASDLTSTTSTVDTDTDPRLPDVAGPSLELRLLRIAEVGGELLHVASMLPDDDPRPDEWFQLLDGFVSTAVDDDTVNAELDRVLADAEEIREGVVPPEPFTFTLTGREGEINVRVGNELSEPVDVVLRVTSPRLEFPDGDVTVTLAPDDVTVVSVPVVARSNGTSPVEVEILTPSMDPLTAPITLTSRFTALTGLGPVLTGGFLLILLTWWFSHWRSRRRAAGRPEKDAPEKDAPEPDAAAPAGE